MNLTRNRFFSLFFIITAVIVNGGCNVERVEPIAATNSCTLAASPEQLSTATIPISIPVSSIGPLLDEITAKRWNLDHCCLEWSLSLLGGEFKLNGYAERSELEFRGSSNKLTMATRVRGKVELRHRRIGPSGNSKWTNPISIGFEGNIEGTSQLKIEENWQLALPDLNIRTDLIKIGPFWGINLADFKVLNDWIEEQVKQRLEKDLKTQITELEFVKKVSKKWWQNLCGTLPIETDLMATGIPLHLEVKPIAVRVTQPQVSETDMQLNLGLVFKMRVVEQPTNSQCNFPEKLNLTDAPPPALQLELPVEIRYETLNQILGSKKFLTVLNDELGKNKADEKVANHSSGAIEELRVSPQKTKLLLEAEINTQIGAADMNLFLSGKPYLQSHEQRIVLNDVEIDTASKHALVMAYGELFVASSIKKLLGALNGRVIFDLKPLMEKNRQLANAALDAWEKNLQVNNQSKERLHIESQLEELRLSRLEICPTHLLLGVSATGKAVAVIK